MKNIFQKISIALAQFKNKGRNWFVAYAEGPHATFWLVVFSFSEAIFFPLPPDLFLIAALTARRMKWVFYALLTTLVSIAGGVVGYGIGIYFFDVIGEPIVKLYGLEQEMITIGNLFSENAFLVIFTAAFTPIPYKIFTIGAGFFSINMFTFLVASFLGRGIRFFVVSYVMYRYGSLIKYLTYKYFNILSIAVLILVVLFFAF